MRNWNYPVAGFLVPAPHVTSLPMRNWNHSCPACPVSAPKLPAYLWGIETHYNRQQTQPKPWLPAYLWGIETPQPRQWRWWEHWVTSLPMRNWNCTLFRQFNIFLQVTSLPMRNWNRRSQRAMPHSRMLPAYLWGIETQSFSSSVAAVPAVTSLPMRNWNPYYIQSVNKSSNRYQPTYEELKPIRLLVGVWASTAVTSLPMRNWNQNQKVWW